MYVGSGHSDNHFNQSDCGCETWKDFNGLCVSLQIAFSTAFCSASFRRLVVINSRVEGGGGATSGTGGARAEDGAEALMVSSPNHHPQLPPLSPEHLRPHRLTLLRLTRHPPIQPSPLPSPSPCRDTSIQALLPTFSGRIPRELSPLGSTASGAARSLPCGFSGSDLAASEASADFVGARLRSPGFQAVCRLRALAWGCAGIPLAAVPTVRALLRSQLVQRQGWRFYAVGSEAR